MEKKIITPNPNDVLNRLRYPLESVNRWEDPCYTKIEESNLDHTFQCLIISRCLFNKLEWLTNYVNPNIVNLMIILHDIGESENGDISVNQQSQMTTEELTERSRVELQAGIRTIGEYLYTPDADEPCPYDGLFLSGLFLNYEARQSSTRPPFKKEAYFTKLVDVLDGATTYLSTHKETSSPKEIHHSLTRIKQALNEFIREGKLKKDEEQNLIDYIIDIVPSEVSDQLKNLLTMEH